MEEIVQIISNLGFPIACVVVMFWMQNKEREAHQAESKEWVNAINRNTVVMEKILTLMGVDAE